MAFPGGSPSDRSILSLVRRSASAARGNLAWLRANLNPFFFLALREEPAALAKLALQLGDLAGERHLVLADREDTLILARRDAPGSLLGMLRFLGSREISYSEVTHSLAPLPGGEGALEILRMEFRRKGEAAAPAGAAGPPAAVRRRVAAALRPFSPPVPRGAREELLRHLWDGNPEYVRLSPPERVARAVWLFHRARSGAGIHVDVQDTAYPAPGGGVESRVLFAAENPPHRDHLVQVMEVFHRLGLGVRRSYALTVETGGSPCFLGTFYVVRRDGGTLGKDSELFRRLRGELHNTQILTTGLDTYREFVLGGLLTGEETSLVNALVGFCHTNLAHARPERFPLEEVTGAFLAHPELTLRLVRLFRLRFDPEEGEGREGRFREALEEARREAAELNTGHRRLDEGRRTVFRAALSFVERTLKTNFFVAEKHALAFRLDPAYLADLGDEFTAGLPPGRPFRVTWFFGRNGMGYHVGFSDIARGGWRTLVARTRDDYVTAAAGLFRECYVLAHTQHLKNKDIYEGGSKLVAVTSAPEVQTPERMAQRLHKVQLAFANAFLDIFVTEGGRARDRRVVDYYGEDEPIELGPDENMHDAMIEEIAALSKRRGYLLGIGIMSSKRVGINHKEYGVTSTGVVKFAEAALREAGIDPRRDPFSVKLTGGPNGDVAGNALRILLDRFPRVQVRLVVDGTAVACDPEGLDRDELSRLLLRADLESFDPRALHPGGFLLYRNRRRAEGVRELYCRAERGAAAVGESWVTADDFFRDVDGLLFEVPADLFLPAGGRPETVDGGNWRRFLGEDGRPTVRAIVEGANSFLSPAARAGLQGAGVIVLRDASANKCGVISSSYEIIGNLLMTEREFLAHKDEYVRDVLSILERRASDEAELIFRRKRENPALSYTEISDALSGEINGHYERLYARFRERPALASAPPFRRALLAHLPAFLRGHGRYRARLRRLPPRYLAAMLAAEVATTIVYRGGFGTEPDRELKGYVARMFPRGG